MKMKKSDEVASSRAAHSLVMMPRCPSETTHYRVKREIRKGLKNDATTM